jgi:predicted transcriptional regulator
MAERRSQLEIIYDMLKAIQNKGGKIKPTHLLYKSNLSHKRMKGYVEDLQTKGLMMVEVNKDEKSMYTITDQGLKFIEDYRKVKEFTDAFGL